MNPRTRSTEAPGRSEGAPGVLGGAGRPPRPGCPAHSRLPPASPGSGPRPRLPPFDSSCLLSIGATAPGNFRLCNPVRLRGQGHPHPCRHSLQRNPGVPRAAPPPSTTSFGPGTMSLTCQVLPGSAPRPVPLCVCAASSSSSSTPLLTDTLAASVSRPPASSAAVTTGRVCLWEFCVLWIKTQKWWHRVMQQVQFQDDGCTNLKSHQWCMRVSFSSHPCWDFCWFFYNFFYYGHSDRCEALSHGGADLHLPDS